MRNLRIDAFFQPRLELQSTPKDIATTHISAVAVDPSDDSIYTTTTSPSNTSSSLVDIDLWKITPHQKHCSSFSAPIIRNDNFTADDQVIALDILADGGSFVQNDAAVCIVTAGGDIALVPITDNAPGTRWNDNSNDEPILPEIVGSVEQGIMSAAWSPDQELLVLVTAPTPPELTDDQIAKGPSLLIMTREFEVLSESTLQTDDFGEERPIALGWGSKATQFHGSEGKQAAAAAALSTNTSDMSGVSPRGVPNADDDDRPRISWRGDSSIFLVSAIEPYASSKHRLIRTFGKNGNLLATSDPTVQGISHTLACKPSGILWATTQRTTNEQRVAFFERNGLPKGHFVLENASETVHELAWNSDGTLLCVWTSLKVQVWSMGNYHWYLKQQFPIHDAISAIAWHTEKPDYLYIATATGVAARQFTWTTSVSPGRAPNDAACAAVVDGFRILLTPLRLQNIPPPMSSLALTIPDNAVPVSVAWADASSKEKSASLLFALLENGNVHSWIFEWGDMSIKGSRSDASLAWMNPRLLCTFEFDLTARQVIATAVRKGDSVKIAVGIIASKGFESLKLATRKVNLHNASTSYLRFESLSLGRAARRILTADSFPPLDDQLNSIYVHEDRLFSNAGGERIDVPAMYSSAHLMRADDGSRRIIGMTSNGRLYCDKEEIARDASSFTFTDSHLIWTNVAHEACFLPSTSLESPEEIDKTPLSRRVERGSRIVTAVPSNMSLILQMPRGNLETITPRPLVLEIVKQSLDTQRYGKAFRICRLHRLDMNILIDHNEQQLHKDVGIFVQQVQQSDHLNLFLSSLNPEHVPRKGRVIGVKEVLTPEIESKRARINALCDAMRAVLETYPDQKDYINTILTTHVRKSPPDFEAALELLQNLKEKDASQADEACRYVIFLTDADKLFNAALGMYDFTLPLLVAHHTPSKDPREYLPFLRELREVKPLELQRFRIDETLERWDRAFSWLVKAGDEQFPLALEFLEKHQLYSQALREFASDPVKLRSVQELYGDWLMEQRRFKEASVLYSQCKQVRKAMDADVKAGAWREALATASELDMDDTEMKHLTRRIASSLTSYGRFTEAATIALDYLSDIDEGVSLLCKDLEFGEAKRRAARFGRQDLMLSSIRPHLLEAADHLLEEFSDMINQGKKSFSRLQELRVRRLEHPDGYYPDVGGEDDIGDGASVAFTTFTRFTRYSAFTANAARRAGNKDKGPESTMSQFTLASKKQQTQTAKSAKREMRKQQTGRKGSIYEEDYLYDSLRKLLSTRLEKAQREAGTILLQLVRFGDDDHLTDTNRSYHYDDEDNEDDFGQSCIQRAYAITNTLTAFEKEMIASHEEAWQASLDDENKLEEERIRAIQEGFSLGLSWTQLQANGLFAPPLRRERIPISEIAWRQPALLPDSST